MPWRYKKTIYLYMLGAIALALAVIVLARDKSLDSELLASLGLVGALAILINNLPDNGKDKDDGKEE